jgi:hypothetical protein
MDAPGASGHWLSEGDRAWYVETVWAAAEGVAVEQVPVDSLLEVDEDCWFRGQPATVREVVRHAQRILEADTELPVILSSDGHVLDGMHRISRALLDGRSTVPAQRLVNDPDPDWLPSEIIQ